MDTEGPVVVATYQSRPEADLARALLESEGIDATVWTDDAAGFHPQLTVVAGARLVVRSRDESAARMVLEGDE